MAVIFWLVGRNAPDFQPVTTPVSDRFGVFRREPLTWVLALFYFVTFGGLFPTPAHGLRPRSDGRVRDRVHAALGVRPALLAGHILVLQQRARLLMPRDEPSSRRLA
jgi:hypothetical protein